MTGLPTIIGGICIGFLLGFLWGSAYSAKWHRDWMAREGFGEYYIDKNNERQFRIKKK